MKLAFILPIYRTTRTIFDGLPLSVPYLVGGLKGYFDELFFEQIDLNNEIKLLNKKSKELGDFPQVVKKIEELCSQGRRFRKMTSNRIPGTLALPGDSEIIFFNNFFEKLYQTLNLKEFDHFFLSTYQIFDEDIFSMLLFAKFVREKSPQKKIIIGGMRNFTKSIKNALNELDYVDALIAGDGIESCRELIRDLQNKQNLKTVYKNFTTEKKVIMCPDYSSFRNFNNFNIRSVEIEKHYNISLEDSNSFNEKILCIPYKFSEDCFWQNCAYCANSGYENDFVQKKVSEIISDIKILKKQCNTKYFIFYNTNFNSNLSFAKKITREFIKNKLNIIWTDSFNLNVLDDELIELLAKSGCIRMDVGMVSMDTKVQKIYNNIIQDNSHREKLKKISNAGIWVNANVIPNLPFIYDINKEIKGFKEIIKYIDTVTINSYRAYVTSDMVKNFEKFNLKVVDERVVIGKFSHPMYFLEKNFKGTIKKRKELFVKNYFDLYNFFKKNNVSTNSKIYYLLCLLYAVYGHKNKEKIKNKILSLE